MEYFGPKSIRLLESYFEQEVINDILLKKCSIPEKKLSHKIWENCQLEECILDESQFDYSELKNVKIKMCNVRSVNFRKTKFSEVTCEQNILIKADFSYSTFSNVKMTESVLPLSSFVNSVFVNSHFRNLDWTRANLSNSVFYSCLFEFDGSFGVTGLRQGHLEKSFFYNCDFSGEIFDDCCIAENVFVKCRFHHIDWSDLEVQRTFFVDCSNSPEGLKKFQKIDLTDSEYLRLFTRSSLV